MYIRFHMLLPHVASKFQIAYAMRSSLLLTKTNKHTIVTTLMIMLLIVMNLKSSIPWKNHSNDIQDNRMDNPVMKNIIKSSLLPDMNIEVIKYNKYITKQLIHAAVKIEFVTLPSSNGSFFV